MRYYAEGIKKAQKELGLKIERFPNLGLSDAEEDDIQLTENIEEWETRSIMTTRVQPR